MNPCFFCWAFHRHLLLLVLGVGRVLDLLISFADLCLFFFIRQIHAQLLLIPRLHDNVCFVLCVDRVRPRPSCFHRFAECMSTLSAQCSPPSPCIVSFLSPSRVHLVLVRRVHISLESFAEPLSIYLSIYIIASILLLFWSSLSPRQSFHSLSHVHVVFGFVGSTSIFS